MMTPVQVVTSPTFGEHKPIKPTLKPIKLAHKLSFNAILNHHLCIWYFSILLGEIKVMQTFKFASVCRRATELFFGLNCCHGEY